MLARLGRQCFTRDVLRERLAPLGTPEEVEHCLDEAFASSDEAYRQSMAAVAHAIQAIAPVAARGRGQSVGADGLDEEDRIVLSVASAAYGEVDKPS